MSNFDDILCGIVLPLSLIIIGIFFSIKFKLFYIFHPIRTLKDMLGGQSDGIRSLCVALAGTLGVGNIVGVASAIVTGGAGSVFWMWISAFCAMSLKYAEVYLAMRFRQSKNGEYYGGAHYYIYYGMNKKLGKMAAYFLSCTFALFCVINSLTTGNLVQVNSVSALLPLSSILFGLAFSLLSFIIIIGGIARIRKITSFLIPLLSFIFIFACAYILLVNLSRLGDIFSLIVKEAFSKKAAVSGFCGYGISEAIRYGVNRGILSNEAGCGTSPIAHASSKTQSYHSQSCLGILEVFVDTILLCTLCAFVILLYGFNDGANPMETVLNSFEFYLGDFGKYLIIVLSISFALATVICQFYYGIESLKYISRKKMSSLIFILTFSATTVIGAIIPMSIMWKISDLTITFMTLFNLTILILLRKEIPSGSNLKN